MPKAWYLMSRPLFNSGYETDEFEAFAQDGFDEVLDSSLGQDIEIYEKKITATPVKTRAVIQNVTNDIYNNNAQRQILCKIGTLKCGQYVKVNGRFWVVSTLPDNNQMYEKAIMLQCRVALKFISPISGEVAEYPVYSVNSTQYGSGETVRSQMRIGSAQQLIYIPYNDETVLIDSGARFLIDKNKSDPTAFRLTQVDTSSYSCGEDDGLIQWTIVETQRDDKTDNIELMVADYYGRSALSVPEVSETGYTIAIIPDGGKAEVTFGEEIVSNVQFSMDGTAIDPVEFDVLITDGSEYGSITEVASDSFVLRALKNRNNIGQEITVEVSNSELGISETMTYKVKGWY